MRRLSLLIILLSAGFVLAQPFTDDVGRTPWTVRERDGLCLLERPVRDFGMVRFVGAPGAPLRLEVLGHRAVFSSGAVRLVRVAPPWHPEHPQRLVLGSTEQRALADPAVTRIYVDGHTDDVGPARANLALSRRRAEAVADYLVQCGVSRERLVVRHHGAQYPVARADSAAARAQNRRTTVRLERTWPDADIATR